MKNIRICSEHFEEKWFYKQQGKAFLKENVLPSPKVKTYNEGQIKVAFFQC